MQIDHITIKVDGTLAARLTPGNVPAVTLSSDGGEAGATLVFEPGQEVEAELFAFAINSVARKSGAPERTDKAHTTARMATVMRALGRDGTDDDLREEGFDDAEIEEHANAARSLAAQMRDRDINDDPVPIGEVPIVAVHAEAGWDGRA